MDNLPPVIPRKAYEHVKALETEARLLGEDIYCRADANYHKTPIYLIEDKHLEHLYQEMCRYSHPKHADDVLEEDSLEEVSWYFLGSAILCYLELQRRALIEGDFPQEAIEHVNFYYAQQLIEGRDVSIEVPTDEMPFFRHINLSRASDIDVQRYYRKLYPWARHEHAQTLLREHNISTISSYFLGAAILCHLELKRRGLAA